MIPDQQGPATPSAADKFDDAHYPAYTMGRAAEILGATQGFLRSHGEAGLTTPQRSAGGHRRYSRHQLRLAARVRELVDRGTAIDAACRIVTLEDQLRAARQRNTDSGPATGSLRPHWRPASARPSKSSRVGVGDRAGEVPRDQHRAAAAAARSGSRSYQAGHLKWPSQGRWNRDTMGPSRRRISWATREARP